ncbi:MAG: hypothetical protein ACXV8Q_03595 [Methylobacter sp.]
MSNSDAALLAIELGHERGLSQADIADWQPLLRFCGGNPLTLRIVILQALKQNLRGREMRLPGLSRPCATASKPSATPMPPKAAINRSARRWLTALTTRLVTMNCRSSRC